LSFLYNVFGVRNGGLIEGKEGVDFGRLTIQDIVPSKLEVNMNTRESIASKYGNQERTTTTFITHFGISTFRLANNILLLCPETA
jgi:hypothetical protein